MKKNLSIYLLVCINSIMTMESTTNAKDLFQCYAQKKALTLVEKIVPKKVMPLVSNPIEVALNNKGTQLLIKDTYNNILKLKEINEKSNNKQLWQVKNNENITLSNPLFSKDDQSIFYLTYDKEAERQAQRGGFAVAGDPILEIIKASVSDGSVIMKSPITPEVKTILLNSNGDKLLLFGGKILIVRDAKTLSGIKSQQFEESVLHAQFDNERIILGFMNSICILENNEIVQSFSSPYFNHFDYNQAKGLLAIKTSKGLALKNLNSKEMIQQKTNELANHYGKILFNASEEHLIHCSNRPLPQIQFLNCMLEPITTPINLPDTINNVSITPDGKLLACDSGTEIYLLDLEALNTALKMDNFFIKKNKIIANQLTLTDSQQTLLACLRDLLTIEDKNSYTITYEQNSELEKTFKSLSPQIKKVIGGLIEAKKPNTNLASKMYQGFSSVLSYLKLH